MLYVWFDLTCITRYFRKLQCSFCTRCFARLKQTNNYFDVSLTMHSIPFVHPPFCCEPPLQFVEVCKEPSAFVLNLLLYQVETNKQIFWCIPPLCIAGALLPFARPPFCCEPFGEACKEASAFVSVLVALRVACTVFMSSTSSSFLWSLEPSPAMSQRVFLIRLWSFDFAYFQN